MRNQFRLGGAALACAVAEAASGTMIIDTTGEWQDATTAVWDHVGQVFVAPLTNPVLSTFELGVGGVQGVYSFSIYEWDTVDDHVVGSALFATGSLAIPGLVVEFVTFDVVVDSVPLIDRE